MECGGQVAQKVQSFRCNPHCIGSPRLGAFRLGSNSRNVPAIRPLGRLDGFTVSDKLGLHGGASHYCVSVQGYSACPA